MSPNAASTYAPPGEFYFQLQFANSPTAQDNAFQEASGLAAEWGEEIGEGGQNIYKHKLPTVARHSNLVLRRGFVSSHSALATWCNQTLAADSSTPIQPQNMLLRLLNAAGTPLAAWSFLDAWPVKWSRSAFEAQEGGLAVERLEFAYAAFQRL